MARSFGINNGDLGTLIDALHVAIIDTQAMIECNLLSNPAEDEPDDTRLRERWTGDLERFRELHERLTEEEKQR